MSANTLTERYIHEVVRRIPADQRDDVAEELRTTIADTIEGGEQSEGAVLTEMGDPIRLAAKYADRPLSLIGPELYPAYVRLLRLLLVIVLPIVTAVIVVLELLDTNKIGSAIGAGVGGVLTVGAQMIAWSTVVFALIERSKHRGEIAGTVPSWTPDDLPEVRQPDRHRLTAAAGASWYALLIGLIVWQQTAKPFGGVAVLDPHLWSGWIWPILAGLVALALISLARLRTGRWTPMLFSWYAVASALFALPLAWVLHQRAFFSPAFLDRVPVYDALYTVTAAGVLIVSVVEVFQRFREMRS